MAKTILGEGRVGDEDFIKASIEKAYERLAYLRIYSIFKVLLKMFSSTDFVIYYPFEVEETKKSYSYAIIPEKLSEIILKVKTIDNSVISLSVTNNKFALKVLSIIFDLKIVFNLNLEDLEILVLKRAQEIACNESTEFYEIKELVNLLSSLGEKKWFVSLNKGKLTLIDDICEIKNKISLG